MIMKSFGKKHKNSYCFSTVKKEVLIKFDGKNFNNMLQYLII